MDHHDIHGSQTDRCHDWSPTFSFLTSAESGACQDSSQTLMPNLWTSGPSRERKHRRALHSRPAPAVFSVSYPGCLGWIFRSHKYPYILRTDAKMRRIAGFFLARAILWHTYSHIGFFFGLPAAACLCRVVAVNDVAQLLVLKIEAGGSTFKTRRGTSYGIWTAGLQASPSVWHCIHPS